MKKKKCNERDRIILYENGSLPDDDFDAPGGGNMQEPDDDVDCTLSFDERGSVAGLSDDMDINVNHTEMLEGETQSSHFDPPPEELEELQSEHFSSLVDTDNDTVDTPDAHTTKRVSPCCQSFVCMSLLTHMLHLAMSLFSSSHIQNSSACILYVRISAYQSVAREVSLRALRVQSMFVISASPLGTGNVNIVRPTVMPNLIPVMMTTRMMPLPTILNKLHRLMRRLVGK